MADADAQVRGLAARALGAMSKSVRNKRVVGALIAALDKPDDTVRMRICDALGTITGEKRPYDPKKTPADKQKTVQAWKTWWASARKSYK